MRNLVSKNGTACKEAPCTSSYLLPSELPSGENITFEDSSFFAKGEVQLPTPAEVRQAAGAEYRIGRPPPVVFHSLKLLVKYGTIITIAEGQCLWAIGRLLPTVPVPEVYGWRQDNGEIFIYMQLVEGITLEQSWPDLDVEGRLDVCTQLYHILEDLRQLKQDPMDQFIGKRSLKLLPSAGFSHKVCTGDINRQPIHDVLFDFKQPAGPFPDIKSFHDWFANLTKRRPRDPDEVPDPWRCGLLDDVPIVFTHADLHRSNIMVSDADDGFPRVLAIIDWHQSGWYPAPWEFYKTRLTARGKEQWEEHYITEFLQSYRGNVNWDYYVCCLGI